MLSKEKLNELFAEIGSGFGYENVQAEFMAFKDIKVRWQRSYKWANFKVADYLSAAPEPVMRALCGSLFARIAGREEAYPHELRDWVTDPAFARGNQPTFLRRSRNLTRSPAGRHRDLSAARGRLLEGGLIDDDPDVHISWSRETSSRRAGECSVLMKVISVPASLDDPDVPGCVLDFCLYRQFCRLQRGFDPDEEEGPGLRDLESRHPQADEAREWLAREGFSP